jgi:hypothetical protein
MLDLTPGTAAQVPRPSWWRRHVVSDTHREPDRDGDPVVLFRTIAVCALFSLPLWVWIVLMLIRRFG